MTFSRRRASTSIWCAAVPAPHLRVARMPARCKGSGHSVRCRCSRRCCSWRASRGYGGQRLRGAGHRVLGHVQGLRTSWLLQVLKAMLQLARKHGVTVDSGYAALVIGVCVLVGFATSLDPSLNLLDAATPAYLINDLTGRIAGRLYA